MNRREWLKLAAAAVGVTLLPREVHWLTPEPAWLERIWTEPRVANSTFVTRPVIRHLIGHRRDGNWFYVAVPHYSLDDAIRCEQFDREHAEAVLETFSACACTLGTQCPEHARMFPSDVPYAT